LHACGTWGAACAVAGIKMEVHVRVGLHIASSAGGKWGKIGASCTESVDELVAGA